MRKQRSWLLATAAILGLTSSGLPAAGAQSSPRLLHSVANRLASPFATPRSAPDGRFYLGHGGAVRGPFHLSGGKYVVNVLVNYNAGFDSGSGQCLFTAYMNGVDDPGRLGLGTAVPVLPSAPYRTAISVTATAGRYKLIVSPTTTCDWSIAILSTAPAAPESTSWGLRATFTSAVASHPSRWCTWGRPSSSRSSIAWLAA